MQTLHPPLHPLTTQSWRQHWPILVGVVLSHLAVVIFFLNTPATVSQATLKIIDISFDMRAPPQINQPAPTVVTRPPEVAPTPVESPITQQPAPPPSKETQTTSNPTPVANEAASNTASEPNIQPLFKLTRLPSFSRKVETIYPAAEKRAGLQATVMAEVTLDAQGKILSIRIIKSGGAAFDQAMQDALARSTFNPGLIDGVAVATRFQIPFRFNLN